MFYYAKYRYNCGRPKNSGKRYKHQIGEKYRIIFAVLKCRYEIN